MASGEDRELPERYDALGFLAGPDVEPNFTEHHREIVERGRSYDPFPAR